MDCIQSYHRGMSLTSLPVQNPIGVNLAFGGGSALEYEGFPFFVDRVWESRGFIIGTGYTQANTVLPGYPDGSQASVNLILFTGASTGLGLQPWFYDFVGSAYRNFNCTLTGSGAETITGHGCTISSFSQVGAVTTFNLKFDGSNTAVYITIGNISVALSAVHCWLPDYPNGAGGVGQYGLFTVDTINHHSQFGWTRNMFMVNAWNNIVHTTAANRNTLLNTVTNKGWSAPGGPNSEGYPIELHAYHALACYQKNPNSGGMWCNLPIDASLDYYTAHANVLFSIMPPGVPIMLEAGNENWNGTGKSRNVLQGLANAAGYTASSFTGTIVGNTLVVSGVTGTITINDNLFYSGSPSGVTISGGSGTTWTLSTSPGNVGPIAMTTNDLTQTYQYLAVMLHTIAGAYRAVFGARFGTDVNVVLGTQQAGIFLANETIQQSITLGYMPATGWNDYNSADYHYLSAAPYLNTTRKAFATSAAWSISGNTLTTASTSGTIAIGQYVVGVGVNPGTQITAGSGTSWTVSGAGQTIGPIVMSTYPVPMDTVAQIQANLAGTDGAGNAQAANSVCYANVGLERLSVLAKFYNLKGANCYEFGLQANNESVSLYNIGATITDPATLPIFQALTQSIFDCGGQMGMRFEGGCAALNALSGTQMLYDQFDYNTVQLIAGASPGIQALTPFYGGATPQRNVVTGPGSFFDSRNWNSNQGATYPTLALSSLAPPFSANGLVPYNVNCLKGGSYTLQVYFTNASGTAGHCDVSLDGSIILTGTSIVTGSITNTLITLGTVVLTKGVHAFILGRSGTSNANITLSSYIYWN